jgi:hypothetical protein
LKKVADEFEGGRRKNNMDDDMSSSKRKNRSDQAEKKQSCMDKLAAQFGSNDKTGSRNDGNRIKFADMNDEEKKERINQLWNKARRYNNKLRFQARL